MEKRNLSQIFNHLVKDEKSDIQILKLTDDILSMYAARLSAGKKLPAHYHREGNEVYQVLGGDGTFDLGEVIEGQVIWTDRLEVHAGDFFEVPAGRVHRLSGGVRDLQMIFYAPLSHLGEDRTFIDC